MNTAKDDIHALLCRLPDNCSLEDVQYHLYVLEEVRRGIERAGKGSDLLAGEGERIAQESRSAIALFLRFSWRCRHMAISLGGFTFAMPAQIGRLMLELQEGPLRQHTPCTSAEEGVAARAIAVVHMGLMLIHPFREGNGRTGRVLATLMALQAGRSLTSRGFAAG